MVSCTDGIYRYNSSIQNQAKSIIIDKTCTKLSFNSLNFTFLEHVTLPNTLIEIEDDVFVGAKIKELLIPASTRLLSYANPFNSIFSLECINVDPNNPKYSSLNGILFSKNFDQLIHYPLQIKSPIYIVPRTVRYLNPYSFTDHQLLQTLIFHDRILELREGCFKFSQSLKSIMIPNKFSLPQNLTNSFLSSNFHFPEDVTFYDDIIRTCELPRHIFDLIFIIPLASIIIL